VTKDRSFIDQVAANTAQEPAVVSRVTDARWDHAGHVTTAGDCPLSQSARGEQRQPVFGVFVQNVEVSPRAAGKAFCGPAAGAVLGG